MDTTILHLLLVTLLIFTSTLMVACLLPLKRSSKSFFPFWMSSGLLSVALVLFQPVILKLLMGQSLVNKILFIDVSTPIYHYFPIENNIYQAFCFNALIYFFIGVFWGMLFQLLVKGLKKEPSKGVKLTCFSLSFIPLMSLLTLVFEILNFAWAKGVFKSFLPNLAIKVFQSVQLLTKGTSLSENAILSLGWPALIESCVFLCLISLVLSLKKEAKQAIILLTAVMLIDTISSLFLGYADNIQYLIKNIIQLIYFTIILLFFTNPNVRDQFLPPVKRKVGEKPKYEKASTQMYAY